MEWVGRYRRLCELARVRDACIDGCECRSAEVDEHCAECREYLDLEHQLTMNFRVRPWCDLPTDQPADAPKSLKWWSRALEQALQEARIPSWER
jgi:hypothetical protein